MNLSEAPLSAQQLTPADQTLVDGVLAGQRRALAKAITLIESTRVFQKSDVARSFLGDTFVDHFAATREWEHRQWQDAVTDWEMKRYFEII